MDQLPDQSGQPGRELVRYEDQFRLCSVRKLGPQDVQGTGRLFRPKPGQSAHDLAGSLVPKGRLPAWCMTQIDGLPPKVQDTAPTRGKIDRPDRDLRRQAQGLRRGSTVRDDRLAPLHIQRLDRLFGRGAARTKARLDRAHICIGFAAPEQT